MIKVLFVCHGNICRSPMAEFLFKDYVAKNGKSTEFYIESCATSTEEIGNSVHYGTRRILNSLGIDCSNKRARQIRQEDFEKFDYIIAMDLNNLRWLRGYKGYEKVKLLLEYAGLSRRHYFFPLECKGENKPHSSVTEKYILKVSQC